MISDREPINGWNAEIGFRRAQQTDDIHIGGESAKWAVVVSGVGVGSQIADRDLVHKVRQNVIVGAHLAIADGVHEIRGVLADRRVFAVVFLHVHALRQYADDRHHRKTDDPHRNGDLDHCERLF